MGTLFDSQPDVSFCFTIPLFKFALRPACNCIQLKDVFIIFFKIFACFKLFYGTEGKKGKSIVHTVKSKTKCTSKYQ